MITAVKPGEERAARMRTRIQVIAGSLGVLLSAAASGCGPRKRAAIVAQVQSDLSRADVQSVRLTVHGVRADGALVELEAGRDVVASMDSMFPGNILVNAVDGMIGAQITLEVTPRVGMAFTHRSRATFVREQWRTYTIFLAGQCSSAAVQQQCVSMSGAGVEFVCGSPDPNNPCVPVEQSATQNYEPAMDASAPSAEAGAMDADASPSLDASDAAVAPSAVVAALFPWTGARLSTGTVGFRWRLPSNATQGRVVICSDYPCSSVTNTSATGATSATLTLAPGRYGYRVQLLDAAGTMVAYTATRPFEVLSNRAAAAVAVGTSLYVNPIDFDRDFALGTRTEGVSRQVSVIADTFAVPVSNAIASLPTFARAIANIGDFNADGFSDLAAVSQLATDTEPRAMSFFIRRDHPSITRAFLFSQSTLPAPNSTLTEPAWAVSGGGDINGDGFADTVIGSPSNSTNNGTATVIYGGPSADAASINMTATTLRGTTPSFGGAVVSGCDFDGDGFADFAVSSVSLDPMNTSPQPVRVYFGGASPPYALVTIDPPATLPNSAVAARWGSTLACGADLDGDGLGDLAIADIAATTSGVRVGAVTAWTLVARAPSRLFAQTGATMGNTDYGHALTMGTIPFGGQPNVHVLIAGAPSGGSRNGEVKVYRFNGTATPEAIVLFSNFPPSGFGGSSLAIADISGLGPSVLMGVRGRGLDTQTAGQPALPRDGCVYSLQTAALPVGPTTTWRTLTAWEPATGEGHGVTMAH